MSLVIMLNEDAKDFNQMTYTSLSRIKQTKIFKDKKGVHNVYAVLLHRPQERIEEHTDLISMDDSASL